MSSLEKVRPLGWGGEKGGWRAQVFVVVVVAVAFGGLRFSSDSGGQPVLPAVGAPNRPPLHAPGISPRFFTQKMEQKEPLKKMPCEAGRARGLRAGRERALGRRGLVQRAWASLGRVPTQAEDIWKALEDIWKALDKTAEAARLNIGGGKQAPKPLAPYLHAGKGHKTLCKALTAVDPLHGPLGLPGGGVGGDR